MLNMFLTLLDTQEDKEKFTYLYDTYKNLMYWIAIKKDKLYRRRRGMCAGYIFLCGKASRQNRRSKPQYVRKRIQRAKKKLKDSLSQSNTDVI